jgi:DNA-binding NtrC family response regulator
MRERLDCAILFSKGAATWPGLRELFAETRRVQIRQLCPEVDIAQQDASEVLVRHAMALRRFDACLLPVSSSNVAWARLMLNMARFSLFTPVLVLARGLKACALDDLCRLGVADFLCEPYCTEELRVRIERLLERPRVASALAASVKENSAVYSPACTGQTQTESQIYDNIRPCPNAELEAYVCAFASRSAASGQPLQQAKRQVVEQFERAYLSEALNRHSGNVAQAARSVRKHRRSFWELMRKRKVDASSYRVNTASICRQAGKINSLEHEDRCELPRP